MLLLYLISTLFFTLRETATINDDDDVYNRTYHEEISEFSKAILKGNDPTVVPKCGDSPVEVTLQLNIFHFSMGLPDDPYVKYNAVLNAKWNDCKVGWNPMDYNGRQGAYLGSSTTGIWVPKMVPWHRGSPTRASLSAWAFRRNLKLKVYEKAHFQNARVTLAISTMEKADCVPEGSFPTETLRCVGHIVSKDRLSDVVFLTGEGYPLTKGIMNVRDWEDVRVNDWKLTSSRQKIVVLDRNQSITEIAPARGHDSMRSAFQLELVFTRSSSSLVVISFPPLFISALWLTASFFLPVQYSPPIIVASFIFYSTVLRDVFEFIPVYNNSLGGEGLAILFLWLGSSFSLILNVLLIHFSARLQSFSVLLVGCLEYAPYFARMEAHYLNSHKYDRLRLNLLPPPLLYIRAVFGIFSFLIFLVIILLW